MAINPAIARLYLGSTVSSDKIARACADAPFLMEQYGITEENTEEYKYQSFSIVALKINSISSPTFTSCEEVEYVHLAGVRI